MTNDKPHNSRNKLQLSMHRATPADFQAMARIHATAFTGTPLDSRMYTGADRCAPDRLQSFIERYEKAVVDPNSYLMVVKARGEDEEEKVVGFAKWAGPVHPKTDMKKMAEKPMPVGIDVEFLTGFLTAMSEKHDQIWKDRPHYYLHLIATDPAYQGLGVGRLLLDFGLDKARKEGLPCYLEASPAGKPIYEHLGYEVVDQFEMDGIVLPCMLWWPEGKKEAKWW
ncbi:acyl-CoA N-acyltransferase [Gaertneriomyces semiglobifer]|nr:acyl-CoA N-acyltransferase [Gaertneriomyces semiglobifer]